MLNFNEGKACDAIIHYLEKRENAYRVDVQSPEDDHHVFPVELTFKLRDKLFALEHTGIEPFAGHVQLEAEADRHLGPVETKLRGFIDSSSVFEVGLPAKALQGRPMREIHAIQDSIAAWIVATAPTLPIKRYGDYRGRPPAVNPPGVPFPMSLVRFETVGIAGRVQFRHILKGNVEEARKDRIEEACKRKFPKLAAWKRASNARTVLVLEENDMQLTNHIIVAETYLPIALSRDDRPDETYLISTSNDPWYGVPILIDESSYFDLSDDGSQVHWEINPSLLVALTKR
jgi:hypothetical protein